MYLLSTTFFTGSQTSKTDNPSSVVSPTLQMFVYVLYSFEGVELIAVAAGEYKATFFRIVLFYVLTIFTIGLCINWQDTTLLRAASGEGISSCSSTNIHVMALLTVHRRLGCDGLPIDVVFKRAGFGAGVRVINAVLLTVVLSTTKSVFHRSS